MAKFVPQPQHRVEVDDYWIETWVAFGLDELADFLAKHTALEQWCAEHHRPEGEP